MPIILLRADQFKISSQRVPLQESPKDLRMRLKNSVKPPNMKIFTTGCCSLNLVPKALFRRLLMLDVTWSLVLAPSEISFESPAGNGPWGVSREDSRPVQISMKSRAGLIPECCCCSLLHAADRSAACALLLVLEAPRGLVLGIKETTCIMICVWHSHE
jgi:hypothetical protein